MKTITNYKGGNTYCRTIIDITKSADKFIIVRFFTMYSPSIN